MKKWNSDDVQSLKGKVAIITGGTSGIGYEDARVLATAGARVIITGRDSEKGAAVIRQIKAEDAETDTAFEVLDLASLESVSDFTKRIKDTFTKIDILINNAGVMTPPERIETKDGFELQFGANYLGHFALTMQLRSLLSRAKGRVVSLSSIVARSGKINFDDLQAAAVYDPMTSYSQSKLACLLFAFELQRQSDLNKWRITSVAAHPGIARTNLLVDKGVKGYTDLLRRYAPFMFQPAQQGALPTLYAATSSKVVPGGYYGPHGFMELRGYPTAAHIPKQALDQNVAEELWKISSNLVKPS
jgi:NAD(P)-dependent dehydrogenase (short-subunit alcohol dehydrogenase family)